MLFLIVFYLNDYYYLADVYLPASDKRTVPDVEECFQVTEENWEFDWEEADMENEAT